MGSRRQASDSSNCSSDMKGDVSSAIDRKSKIQIDGSSSPTESKGHSPTSNADFISASKTTGSSVIDRNSDSQIGGESPIVTKPNGKSLMFPTTPSKPIMKIAASSAVQSENRGNAAVSSVNGPKSHGKSVVVSGDDDAIMGFGEVTLGPHEAELCFRLIHFWEARNPHTKTLIGEELLIIDEQGNVMQGFIPASRVQAFLPRLIAGTMYRLKNFFGSRSKAVFRVSDHSVTVTFAWNTVLRPLENSLVHFPEDRFRFYSHEEFDAQCDLKGDLYDYVGHMKLVNGQSITEHPIIDDADVADKRHVVVHVQTHDGPVMKLYLWDQAATVFCHKFKSYASTPRVVLVTTVNPKRLGGTLALSSMASSRVFMENDVQPTSDYHKWLGLNSDVANKVNPTLVTKPETVTVGELFSYMKQPNAKMAWFECIATIDDVQQGAPWYYIACAGCNTKANKGPSSLVCTNVKCAKSEVVGVPQYLSKISVYDESDQAMFVLLGEAGYQLTGKHASEFVRSYFEYNDEIKADQTVPVPQALLDTIGQTHRFVVKVSNHNLTGKTKTITVTKVLPVKDPNTGVKDSASERVRKVSGCAESLEAKRAKSG